MSKAGPHRVEVKIRAFRLVQRRVGVILKHMSSFEIKLLDIMRADKVVDRISGCAGLVYVLENPPNTIPRRIAVKTIGPGLLNKSSLPEAIRIFQREIEQWLRYGNHSLILKPFRVEWIDDRPLVVMPYCEASIRDVIDHRQETISVKIAAAIQICHGLSYARTKGLIAHQDLKPENILVSDLHKKYTRTHPIRWHVRISDFGMANAMSEIGRPYGSRPYMAPEQYHKNKDFDCVDVFSTGVIIVELMTGLHPVGERTSKVWPKVEEGKPKRFSRKRFWKAWAVQEQKNFNWVENIPDDIRSLCQSMLSSETKLRPGINEAESILKESLAKFDSAMLMQVNVVLNFFDDLSVGILPTK